MRVRRRRRTGLLLPAGVDRAEVVDALRRWDRAAREVQPGVVAFGDGLELCGPEPVPVCRHPVAWLTRRRPSSYSGRVVSPAETGRRDDDLDDVLCGLASRLGGRASCGPGWSDDVLEAFLPDVVWPALARRMLAGPLPAARLDVVSQDADDVSYEVHDDASGLVLSFDAPVHRSNLPYRAATGLRTDWCTVCRVELGPGCGDEERALAGRVLLTLARATGGLLLDGSGFQVTRDDLPAVRAAPPGDDGVFRPPTYTRVMHSLVPPAGLAVVALAWGYGVGDDDRASVVAPVQDVVPPAAVSVLRYAIAALAVLLVVRNWRFAVRVQDATVIVPGVLRTRRIPVEQVLGVVTVDRRGAVLQWREPGGRQRDTSLRGFWAGGLLPALEVAENSSELRRLEQAIRCARPRPSRTPGPPATPAPAAPVVRPRRRGGV